MGQVPQPGGHGDAGRASANNQDLMSARSFTICERLLSMRSSRTETSPRAVAETACSCDMESAGWSDDELAQAMGCSRISSSLSGRNALMGIWK